MKLQPYYVYEPNGGIIKPHNKNEGATMKYEYAFKYQIGRLDDTATIEGILPKLEDLHENINDMVGGFFMPEEYELVSHSLTVIGSQLVLTLMFRRPAQA